MKRILAVGTVFAFLAMATTSIAQEDTSNKSTVREATTGVKKGTEKAWKGTRKAAKSVGNETAELATKGKAKATDKKLPEWIGPEGQVIYVDDGSKYYWINEKGGRVFVTKDQLKPKKHE